MVKKIIGYIFAVIVIFISVLVIVDIVQVTPEALSRKAVQAGLNNNEVNLSAKYLKILPLGAASLKNLGIKKYRGRLAYHLVAEADTLAAISSMFKAKAKAESFVDVKKMHSLAFLQHLEVSNKEDEDKEIIYDQRRNIMRIGDEERKILPDSQDPLSSIFYIQNQELHLGKSITLYINTNQKNYDLKVIVRSVQDLEIDGKTFKLWTLTADVKRHDKSPRHSSSFNMWLLEDPRNNKKVPVLIKAMTNIGPITVYFSS